MWVPADWGVTVDGTGSLVVDAAGPSGGSDGIGSPHAEST